MCASNSAIHTFAVSAPSDLKDPDYTIHANTAALIENLAERNDVSLSVKFKSGTSMYWSRQGRSIIGNSVPTNSWVVCLFCF